MASGSRRKRGNDEYIFIDGKAMRADEAVRINVGDTSVPGQDEAPAAPGAQSPGAQAAGADKRTGKRTGKLGKKGKAREALEDMRDDDALELTDEARAGELGSGHARVLMAEERRKLRTKYWAFGAVLIVLALFSLCLSSQHPGQLKVIAATARKVTAGAPAATARKVTAGAPAARRATAARKAAPARTARKVTAGAPAARRATAARTARKASRRLARSRSAFLQCP